jgi:tRNA A-37 threonylcarbamoyl transferase component Bud32
MTMQAADWNGLVLAGGRYKITAKLGEGGMGSVYRALDQNIDADVVIKVPRQAMMEDPDFAGRFTREIRSLVKLSHPHIVKVTDVGTLEGTPFAVMQFLPGGTLDDQRTMGAGGLPLPGDPKKIPRWLAAVAEALDYVHTQGYVHRDVKPGNILFDAEGHAFLSDFGVAKVLASSPEAKASQTAMTGAGMVLGTPEYMAPELIMGESFDGRVDQYALAVTVYEILCGRRPFESDAKTKLLVLHTSSTPPPLTKWCPSLPEGLSQAVMMGLAKSPNDRYRSCAALARAVIAEAQNAVATTDHRVRLVCPACGKGGSVAAADYARLRESGKHAACPACKVAMEVAGPDAARPSGATRTFAVSASGGLRTEPRDPGTIAGATSAFSTARNPAGARAQTPGPARAQTVPQYLPAAASQSPADAPYALAPEPRQTKTVIQRQVSRPADGAANSPIGNLVTSDPRRSHAASTSGGGAQQSNKTIPFWAIVAGGIWTAAVVAFGAFLFLPWLRSEPSSTPPSPTGPNVAAAASATAPAPQTPPSAPSPAIAATQTHSSPPPEASAAVAPGVDPKTLHAPENKADPGKAVAAQDEGDHAKIQVASSASPRAEKNPTAPSPTEPKPAPAPEKPRFDATLLARKPLKLKESLEKVLAAPGSHSSAVVIPTGMYELSRSRNDRPDGQRKYTVTELRFESRGRSGKFDLVAGAARDVDLEPRLAERLDALSKDQLEQKPAILTLGITESGECGLVSVAILQKSQPRFKGGITPDIDYWTLAVNPDGARPAKGEDADWQQNDRMLKLANYYKRMLNGQKRMFETMQMSQVQAQMGALWANVMREAAAADAAQRALQSRINGR